MAETTNSIDLDPKKALKALQELGDKTKELSKIIEDSLGKDSAKSIEKLEETAEKGTSKITTYFRNLGQRVKEDMKAAFDVAGVLAGAKFGAELGKGVKSVFDMERAFDRLNARLGLTQKAFDSFKVNLGRKAAETGTALEDVLPGVETVAAKGELKNPAQLADVGKMLGQLKQTTGEDTEAIAEQVVEILKSQGKKVTSQSFKEVLDALQGARTAGGFKNVSEVGGTVEAISPYAKRLGLNTRETAGLAAQASRAGSAGQDILKQLTEKMGDQVERQKLQGILGIDLMKNGKLDAGQIGKINTKQFSGVSAEKMSEITGFQGAGGNDFVRFVEAFKDSQENFKKVVSGSDETASQFAVASDNFASKIGQFKQRTMEAGREIGEGLSGAANALLKGDLKGATDKVSNAGKALQENAGTVAAALGTTAAVGVLTGGSLKKLLSSVGGGGMVGGLLKGEAAKAAGVTPVYVTNASEIGGGGGLGAMEKLSKFGALGKLGAIGGAAAGGAGLAMAVDSIPAVHNMAQDITGKIFDALGIGFDKQAANNGQDEFRAKKIAEQSGLNPQDAMVIAQAVEKANLKVVNDGPMTNPSDVSSRGGKR